MMDISVALTNPYTLDYFTLHRYQQFLNNFGENRPFVFMTENVPGVIYPEGDNDLKRRPEAQVQAKSIVVITKFALRGESEQGFYGVNYQPDIVKWRGNHFLVNRVEDYSDFGPGFVKCSCSSWDMVDNPPDTGAPIPIMVRFSPALLTGLPNPVVFYATVGQTAFSLPGTVVGAVLFYRNGQLITMGVDYAISDGVIMLVRPALANDIFVAIYASVTAGKCA